MRRVSVCPKTGLRRGAWTPEEDSLLTKYITRYGIWNWIQIPKYAGLLRCGKSCRLRWLNYLRPNIRRGNFTKEEDEYIITMHQKLGNRWSVMAASLPGRNDNEIKNHWNTHLSKCQKRISTSKAIKGEIMVSDTPTTQDIECSYDCPSSSSSYYSRSFYGGAKEQENPASLEAGWDFHCSFWNELFQVQHSEDISKQYSPSSTTLLIGSFNNTFCTLGDQNK